MLLEQTTGKAPEVVLLNGSGQDETCGLAEKIADAGLRAAKTDWESLEKTQSACLVLFEANPRNIESYTRYRMVCERQDLHHFLVWGPDLSEFEERELLGDVGEIFLQEIDLEPRRLRAIVKRAWAGLEALEAANHLQNVLRSMRDIQKLEKQKGSLQGLLNATCQSLVQNRGYKHAWLAIMDSQNHPTIAVAAGLNGRFPDFRDQLKEDRLPPCLCQAADDHVDYQKREPLKDCEGCPLIGEYEGQMGLSCRINLDEGMWAQCTVSVPEYLSVTDNDHLVFYEVCQEIGRILREFRNRERVHHLLEIIRNVPESMSMVSRDFRYQVVNASYERNFRLPANKIIGTHIKDLFGEEIFTEQIKPRLERTLRGEVVRYEIYIDFPGQGNRWMEMLYLPYRNPSGEVEAVIVHGHDITKRKQAEEAVIRQKEEFSAVISASNLGTWNWHIDEGRIVVNQRWGGMLGYDDLGSEVPFDFILKSLHPDDRETLMKSLETYLNSPMGAFECEFRLRHRHGHWVWIHGSGRLLKASDESGGRVMTGIQLDVSERIKHYELQRDAQKQQKLLQEAINSTEDGIVITRAEWPAGGPRIVFASEGFCRLTGYSREELIGKTPGILQSDKTNFKAVEELKKCLAEGRSFEGETTNRRKDGTYYQVGWRVSPVRDEYGNITHYISVQRDVSEQREIEARVNLMTKMESIGQLAAGIAHEINTPSQFINDNLSFISDCWTDAEPLLKESIAGLPDPEERRALEETFAEVPVALEDASEGVSRIKSIVTAMREFSHPQDKFVANDLNHAIETTTTVARNEWKYGSQVEFDLDENLPLVPCVLGDINQALLNLVVNAAHAILSRFGEGQRKGIIRISTERVESMARICVSDNGCGIPESAQSRIFDPFFTTKKVGQGTGQGLYLAHNAIVKKHNGNLYFETKQGEGTTFIIELPLEREDFPNG